MKIINVSVDIESQRLSSRSTSSQKMNIMKTFPNSRKKPKRRKKARKTKGTQPEKLRPDTDRVSDET